LPRATSKDTRTKQLRVLFFDHTAKMGGGEIALLNLIRSLDRELVYPIVVLGENGPLEDLLRSECEVHVFKLGERVARIRKDDLGWRSLAKFESIAVSGRYAWRLASFARQMEADLIHTNSLKADLIGGLAGKLAGIRIIWHVRDRIEPDYLPRAVVKLIRTLGRNVPDYVIANSEATLRTLHLEASNPGMAIASGVALESKRQVVHDGTPLSSEPVNELTGNSEMRVGLAGRIAPWKGQDVFIRAAAMLQSEFPNTRFEIIGAPLFAEREYEDRLHALCKELGVESRVVFHGFVSGIGSLLEQMDLMVHASITGEPLGQVIIEAMAAGKAVVATNGGGVPEIVQDGFTGLLVPMGDAVAMADAIRGLLRDPQRRQRMGARGRERVVQNFTIETTARKVEAIYRALAGFA
jgi:glycosyltransferase involved in cell wall biosynthesis